MLRHGNAIYTSATLTVFFAWGLFSNRRAPISFLDNPFTEFSHSKVVQPLTFTSHCCKRMINAGLRAQNISHLLGSTTVSKSGRI